MKQSPKAFLDTLANTQELVAKATTWPPGNQLARGPKSMATPTRAGCSVFFLFPKRGLRLKLASVLHGELLARLHAKGDNGLKGMNI